MFGLAMAWSPADPRIPLCPAELFENSFEVGTFSGRITEASPYATAKAITSVVIALAERMPVSERPLVGVRARPSATATTAPMMEATDAACTRPAQPMASAGRRKAHFVVTAGK